MSEDLMKSIIGQIDSIEERPMPEPKQPAQPAKLHYFGADVDEPKEEGTRGLIPTGRYKDKEAVVTFLREKETDRITCVYLACDGITEADYFHPAAVPDDEDRTDVFCFVMPTGFEKLAPVDQLREVTRIAMLNAVDDSANLVLGKGIGAMGIQAVVPEVTETEMACCDIAMLVMLHWMQFRFNMPTTVAMRLMAKMPEAIPTFWQMISEMPNFPALRDLKYTGEQVERAFKQYSQRLQDQSGAAPEAFDRAMKRLVAYRPYFLLAEGKTFAESVAELEAILNDQRTQVYLNMDDLSFKINPAGAPGEDCQCIFCMMRRSMEAARQAQTFPSFPTGSVLEGTSDEPDEVKRERLRQERRDRINKRNRRARGI